jgi:hypothetical protein
MGSEAHAKLGRSRTDTDSGMTGRYFCRPDTYHGPLVFGDRRKRPSETPLRRHPLFRLACGALMLTSQGCALSYTDAAGDHHAIGLLDIVVRPSTAPQTFAGSVVEITSLGFSVGRTAQGGYLTAGYNREVTAWS